MPSQRDLWL